jgi:hypothetical protein
MSAHKSQGFIIICFWEEFLEQESKFTFGIHSEIPDENQ